VFVVNVFVAFQVLFMEHLGRLKFAYSRLGLKRLPGINTKNKTLDPVKCMQVKPKPAKVKYLSSAPL